MRKVLDAYSDLQPEFAPLREQASALDTMLFGKDGLAFTLLAYSEQRTAMHDQLDALQTGGHMKLLAEIAGEGYVKNLVSVIAAYDAMVMGMLKGVIADDAQLGPMLREVQNLVVSYAGYISATVDSDDPETGVAALKALAPIDNVRRMAATGAKATPAAEPTPAPAP